MSLMSEQKLYELNKIYYIMNLRLLSVQYLSTSYTRKADQENIVRACETLLGFCFEKKILINTPFNDDGTLKKEYEVYESDLTEKGRLIFEELTDKWFSYTDRTQKYDNITMLEKWYSKMK